MTAAYDDALLKAVAALPVPPLPLPLWKHVILPYAAFLPLRFRMSDPHWSWIHFQPYAGNVAFLHDATAVSTEPAFRGTEDRHHCNQIIFICDKPWKDIDRTTIHVRIKMLHGFPPRIVPYGISIGNVVFDANGRPVDAIWSLLQGRPEGNDEGVDDVTVSLTRHDDTKTVTVGSSLDPVVRPLRQTSTTKEHENRSDLGPGAHVFICTSRAVELRFVPPPYI